MAYEGEKTSGRGYPLAKVLGLSLVAKPVLPVVKMMSLKRRPLQLAAGVLFCRREHVNGAGIQRSCDIANRDKWRSAIIIHNIGNRSYGISSK
jgi:hypothetical protein